MFKNLKTCELSIKGSADFKVGYASGENGVRGGGGICTSENKWLKVRVIKKIEARLSKRIGVCWQE